MTEILSIEIMDEFYVIKIRDLYLKIPATGPENLRTLIIILTCFKKNLRSSHGIFSMEEIARALPGFRGETRQSIHTHLKYFAECGYNFRNFLNYNKTKDTELIEALKEELKENPLVLNPSEVADRLNERLGRDDLNNQHILLALNHISYGEIHKGLSEKFESGDIHYKEEELLSLMEKDPPCPQKLKQQDIEDVCGKGAKFGVPTAIKNLITPKAALEKINDSIRVAIFCLILYFHGVPLSVLGLWFGVDKVTVLRWILGLIASIWPFIYEQIQKKLHPYGVYIDEKWIKIRKVWYYWFVVLDIDTHIPILSLLSPSRDKLVCKWIGVKLKSLGKVPKIIITDGLEGYKHLLPEVKHILCLFHHQKGVITWLKERFQSPQAIEERRKLMHSIFQTTDKRTVLSRISRLKSQAFSLEIEEWMKLLEKKLDRLLPAVGSSKIPSTTNGIERFFGRFNRFYKTRSGFFSVASAKKELALFQVMYLFTKQPGSLVAPIEKIIPEAKEMPFYKLINNPIEEILGIKIPIKCQGGLKNMGKREIENQFFKKAA